MKLFKMSDEEKPASSSIIEEDVSEMEVVDASAVEDSNNEDDERKVCSIASAINSVTISSLELETQVLSVAVSIHSYIKSRPTLTITEMFSAMGSDKNRLRK